GQCRSPNGMTLRFAQIFTHSANRFFGLLATAQEISVRDQMLPIRIPNRSRARNLTKRWARGTHTVSEYPVYLRKKLPLKNGSSDRFPSPKLSHKLFMHQLSRQNARECHVVCLSQAGPLLHFLNELAYRLWFEISTFAQRFGREQIRNVFTRPLVEKAAVDGR